MRLTLSSLALSMIVASLGSASLASSFHHQLVARSHLHLLSPRQASNTCNQICTAADQYEKTCSKSSCVCTITSSALLQTCINCLIVHGPSASDIANVQKIINAFNTGCAIFLDVPSLTQPVVPSTSTSSAQSISSTTASTTTIQTSPTTTVSISSSVLQHDITSTLIVTVNAASTTDDSTSSATAGLPVTGNAMRNEMVLHGIGAMFGLALGIFLVVI